MFIIFGLCQEKLAQKKATGEESKGKGSKQRVAKVDTSDIADTDPAVIQNFLQFPMNRRMRVVQVDGADSIKAIQDEFQFGGPFILRPKRGKSLVKLLGVPRPQCQRLTP